MVELPQGELEPKQTVAYVPLDDRPVNDDRVVYLGQSLGYEVAVPERAWYHTSLDEQESNPNGLPYGDRGSLWDWVAQQDQAGCDLFVLSLDQLLYGGLVNSRSVQNGQPITFPDGRVLTQEAAMVEYLQPLVEDENNRVYLLDTVMRLAPTVGYEGFGLEGYATLRTFAMQARPALAGEELTIDNIVAGYALGEDGSLLVPEESLSDEMLSNYYQARERKLRLAEQVLELIAPLENVELLIGVDEIGRAHV